jgi:enoyl-[acyl-carrier-protein] reductase (NADH)
MNILKGKVALVTGVAAKRGMGHGVALRLAGEGANVVVKRWTQPSPKQLKDLARSIYWFIVPLFAAR